MIVVVELFRTGIEHQVFNAALLQALVAAYPDEQIVFWAEEAHIAQVSGLIPLLPVRYRVIAVASRRATFFGRLLADCRIVREVMLASSGIDNRIVFSSTSIPMLWAIRLFGGAPSHQVGAVLHGGLAELQSSARFNLLKRVMGLRWSLTHAPGFITFWVLEQGIYLELQKIIPEHIHKFAVLQHPLPPDLMGQAHQPVFRPLRVGLLGLATPQKGLMCFLRLAKAAQGKGVVFDLVGRVHQSYRAQVAEDLHYLSRLPDLEPIPRTDFVSQVKQLSYVAFFFDGSHYSLTASGVLLDCIALGIPLIGRKHPHFDILQAKVGEIGFFCDPGGEAKMIEDILNNVGQERYLAQCQAMRRLSEDRTAAALGLHIKAMLYSRS